MKKKKNVLAGRVFAAVTALASAALTAAPMPLVEKPLSPQVTGYLPQGDWSAGGRMRVSFTAKWRDVVSTRPGYMWSGVILAVNGVAPDGKKLFLKTVNLGQGDNPHSEHSFTFRLPPSTSDLSIQLGVKVATGTAVFSDVKAELHPVDPAKTLVHRFPLQYHRDGKPRDVVYAERFPVPARTPPAADGETGFAFFRVPSPRRTFDRFPPEAEALTDVFPLNAAPGETALVFVGVYAAHGARGLLASPGVVRAADGPAAGAGVELLRAHNWDQTGDCGFAQTYWTVPEPLVPLEGKPFDLAAGTTALLALRLRVPASLRAGAYELPLAVAGARGTRTAKIVLNVRRFAPERPPVDRFLTIAHVGGYGNAPHRMIELCREFKARGIEGLLLPCQYGKGMLELRRGADGKLAVDRFDRLDHALAGYRAAGMTGGIIVHFSDKLEVAVAKALGISLGAAEERQGENATLHPVMKTPAFMRAQEEALRSVRDRCGGVPVVVFGMDEPDTPDRVPRARWEIDRIRAAGLRSGLYAGMTAFTNTLPDVIVTTSPPDGHNWTTITNVAARTGARTYRYGGSGSYAYAFGGMTPSRTVHGWGAYLSGERAHTVWCFGAESPTDFGGRRQFDGWATLNRYDRDMRTVYMLQFEGVCAGVDDYGYLYTLERLLAARPGSPRAREIAAAFARLCEEMRPRIPYRLSAAFLLSPEDFPQAPNNPELEALRERLAGWIGELLP